MAKSSIECWQLLCSNSVELYCLYDFVARSKRTQYPEVKRNSPTMKISVDISNRYILSCEFVSMCNNIVFFVFVFYFENHFRVTYI